MQPTPAAGRILAVDDNPGNLRLLQSLLTQEGYVVHPACGAQMALLFLESDLPDLILLDAVMPGMDGYQLCERLRADERTREIPVVFISAADELLNKAKAFASGGVDYIVKPFLAEEVLARVATHLSLYRLRRQMDALVAARTAELQARIDRLAAELAACRQELGQRPAEAAPDGGGRPMPRQ